MPVVEDSIEVDASPGVIWDYLVDPDKQVLWQQSTLEIHQDQPGEPERGTTYRGVAKVAGRKLPWTAEVTDIERPRRMAFSSLEAPVSFAIEQTLEDLGDRTRLHFRNEAGSFGSFWGKLADPVVVKLYSRSVRADLESLKMLVESQNA